MRFLLPILILSLATAALAQPKAPDPTLHLFVPPTLQWNPRTQNLRPADLQTPADLAKVNGNIVFGMTPEQVAAQLPSMPPSLSWSTLRSAREYTSDVRFFWVRLDDLPEWRKKLHGCVGNASYVAFLFTARGLARMSFRLIPDAACTSVTEAAQELLARYMPIGPEIAISVRYTTPPAEVVDVTDPTASLLLPVRWRMGGT